jgi:hypothetical protein
LSLLLALLMALLFAPQPGVAQFSLPPMPPPPSMDSARSAVIYVARRGWHLDIGFAASALQLPLKSVAAEFPGMQYLFFGYGDERYLLAKHHTAPVLLAALWPGRAVLLATGLSSAPQDAFGTAQVIALPVTPKQAADAQAFVWQSLDKRALDAGGDRVKSFARGPYEGSLYYAATQRYSAFHTCNTWVAEALKAAALPIRSVGVIFAGRLWTQVGRLERRLSTDARDTAPPGAAQLQGGFVPSWQTTVVPEF